jgi:hypothetical protein
MEQKLTQEQIENALDAWDAWDAVANKGRLSSVEVVKAVAPHVQYAVAKRNTPKQAPSESCPYCGPECFGGAAHKAKVEDGVQYEAPSAPICVDVIEAALKVYIEKLLERRGYERSHPSAKKDGLAAMTAAAQVIQTTRDARWAESIKEEVSRYDFNAAIQQYDLLENVRARVIAKPEPTPEERVLEVLNRHNFLIDDRKSVAAEIVSALNLPSLDRYLDAAEAKKGKKEGKP